MMRTRVVALLVLLVAASCSGPRSPLDVGVKEINTDVLIGPVPPRVVVVPPAAPPRPINFPGFVQPPVVPTPAPTPPPVACPRAGELAPVRDAIATGSEVPPPEASYRFMNQGSWRMGGRNGTFPSTQTRTVTNVRHPAEGGGYSFDVSIPDPAGEVTTTTTYHVYPSQPTPVDPAAGIYLDAVVSRRDGAVEQTFTPVPPLLLLPFPAEIALSWSTRGVDPQSQTVMAFDARIARQGVVDACGTKLAAWVVDVTNGAITSPTMQVTFTSTLQIAPQYGGLVIADNVVQQGTVQESPTGAPQEFQSSNRARIGVVPRDPA